MFKLRQQIIALAVLTSVTSVTFAADAKPTPVARPARLTADKQPLPNPTSIGTTAKLAVIGNRLGGLPEKAVSRLWTIDSEASFVEQTRREMTKSGIDLDGFNYVGDSMVGFTRCALSVDNGLVRKMILIRPSMTKASTEALMEKIASDSQSAPKKDDKERITFKVKGINFYECAVGKWTKVTPAETHEVLGKRGSHTVTTEESKDSGPAGIEIGIADNDWHALIVSKDPEVLKAIQDGVLLKGMKPFEAYLAMKDFRLYRQKQGDKVVWTWTSKQVEATDMSVTTTTLDTYTRTNYTMSEKPIAKATFVNGVIDSIENEETMFEPPKEK